MGWRPNISIPNHLSQSGPVITQYASNLHMVHRGNNSNHLWHSSTGDGFDWTVPAQIPEHLTQSSPTITEFDGNLHMVHRGNNSNRLWHSWFDGNDWTTPAQIPDHLSQSGPTITEFDGNLHMVHRGNTSNNLWHSWFDGNDWITPIQIPDHLSQSGPTITEFDGNLHMVHRGNTSNNLWHSWFDGNDWTTPVQIPGQSSQSPPTIATFNNLLHMVHRGNSTNQLWYAQFHPATQQWTANVPIPNQSSKAIAAIAPFGSRLYMSHIGDSSNKVWVSYTDGFPLSEIRVGFKVLSGAPTTSWLANMQQIFASWNYTVTLVDIEQLDLAPLEVVNIGECVRGEITEEQRQLFQFRRNLDCDVIAVYFVLATNPPANGCAAHQDVPACIVASGASPWTLAHEVGHVLGLKHVDDDTRLMYGGGTGNIQDPPPELVVREAVTMAESPHSREGQ